MNIMSRFTDLIERAGAAGGKLAPCISHPLIAKPARSFAMLTAVTMAIGFAQQTSAAPPGSPTANEVFSGCTFDAGMLDDLLNISNSDRNALTDSDADPQGDVVAHYIVIYRADTQNNGQVLSAGGATGVVVCVATNKTVSASAEGVPVPNGVDHPGAASVDILATQGGSVLQFDVNGGSRDGDVENRFCHSTDTGIDCVLVQEPLP